MKLKKKTASGIVLPTAAKEQPQMAEVIEVGPGGIVDGNEVKMEVKVGDKVIFSKYAGNEIKADGENYIILRTKRYISYSRIIILISRRMN